VRIGCGIGFAKPPVWWGRGWGGWIRSWLTEAEGIAAGSVGAQTRPRQVADRAVLASSLMDQALDRRGSQAMGDAHVLQPFRIGSESHGVAGCTFGHWARHPVGRWGTGRGSFVARWGWWG